MADTAPVARDLSAPQSKMVVSRPEVVKGAGEYEDREIFRFVLSDSSVDRHGDTIKVEGWKLDAFRSNPVVLFGHKANAFPVGKSVREWVEDAKLKGEVVFTSKEENPDGYRTGLLVKGGFLNTVSVGFHPLKYVEVTDRKGSGWWPPVDFLEQELREYSIVPIPANPNAMQEAKAEGLGDAVDMLAEWATRVLEQTKGSGMWVPRAQAGLIIRGIEPAKVYSVPTPAPEPTITPEPMITREDFSDALIKAAEEAARTAKMQRTGRLD